MIVSNPSNHARIDARIAELRARLAANVGELQHRVTRVRTLMSPRTYLGNPWVRFGLGMAVGYLVGRRRKPALLTDGHASAGAAESLIHAALRSTVMTLAASLIQRALTPTTPSDDSQD